MRTVARMRLDGPASSSASWAFAFCGDDDAARALRAIDERTSSATLVEPMLDLKAKLASAGLVSQDDIARAEAQKKNRKKGKRKKKSGAPGGFVCVPPRLPSALR